MNRMERKERKLYRGNGWETQRKKCLERDNHKCRVCSKPTNKVHHVIPWKISHDNKLINLLTLCDKHHKNLDNKFLTHGNTHFLRNLILQNARLEVDDMLKKWS